MGLALGVSAVTYNNTLPRELVMLSEMATCLYALTATRDYGYGPSASSVPTKVIQMLQFSKAAEVRQAVHVEMGLVHDPARNVQVCGG